MAKNLYEQMFRQEKTLWWHVSKRELVESFVLAFGELRERYLDVGCGTGAMMEEMKKYFREIEGLDGSAEAIKFCQRRKLKKVTKADFEKKLPVPSGRFDVVTALDVVEHVSDDTGLVSEIFRVLRPGGRLVITVPAYRWLWTYWDESLGHKRRYRAQEIRQLLRRNGFRVDRVSYFNSFLMSAVPIRLVKNYLGRQSSDFLDVPGPVNAFILFAARIEQFLLKFVDIPFGTSIIAVGGKPK